MSRNEAVRQEVLRLDEYRCQITGRLGPQAGGDNLLQVDHVRELGMGGSDARDVVENMITLYLPVHKMKTDKKFFIEKWDRANGVLEISDETHHIITRNPKALKKLFDIEELWFYRKDKAEKGIEITNRLSAYSLIDRDVAKDAYELSQMYKTEDPEAKSFKEYLASRGIDPALRSIASLYKKSLDLNFPWEEGWSATDYRRQLKDAGLIKARRSHWLVYKPLQAVNSNGQGIVIGIFRGTDDQMADAIDPSKGEIAVRIGRAMGIKLENDQAILRNGENLAVKNLSVMAVLGAPIEE